MYFGCTIFHENRSRKSAFEIGGTGRRVKFLATQLSIGESNKHLNKC